MMRHISVVLTGALFGAGLALSGMLNPSKVAGFLDLFGVWDPSLAFVMGGGVVANFIGHRIVTRRAGRFMRPASVCRQARALMPGCCLVRACSGLAGAWRAVPGAGDVLASSGAGRCGSVRDDDAGRPCRRQDADQRSGGAPRPAGIIICPQG